MSCLWMMTPARPAENERVGRLEHRWDLVDGRCIHTRASVEPQPARNPPVVLVHGLIVSSAYMVPTALRLASEYRVYAPDLPGFGDSDKPPHALGVPELADALVAWMDEVGLERPVLVGNSFGCQIIVEVAVRYPERVLRAVLQGPTIDRFARTLPQQIGRGLLDLVGEHPSQPFVVARAFAKMGLRRSLATFRFAQQDRTADKLPLVRMPVLVVRGSRDPLVSRRWAEEVTRLLPQGELVVIPGAPHTLNYSTPSRFLQVLRPFLAGADDENVRLRSGN